MTGDFEPCLDLVWQFDGIKDDSAPGETFSTRYGVTEMTYADALRHGWVKNDFRHATVDDCKAILWHLCWLASNCETLPKGVDLMVFNDTMLTGGGHALGLLSRIVGATDTGPGLFVLAQKMKPDTLVDKIADGDEEYFKTLRNAPLYIKGWTRREEFMKQHAHAMMA